MSFEHSYVLRMRVYQQFLRWKEQELFLEPAALHEMDMHGGICQVYLSVLCGCIDYDEDMTEEARQHLISMDGPHGYAYYRMLVACRRSQK